MKKIKLTWWVDGQAYLAGDGVVSNIDSLNAARGELIVYYVNGNSLHIYNRPLNLLSELVEVKTG